jgi:hypothetical protein
MWDNPILAWLRRGDAFFYGLGTGGWQRGGTNYWLREGGGYFTTRYRAGHNDRVEADLLLNVIGRAGGGGLGSLSLRHANSANAFRQVYQSFHGRTPTPTAPTTPILPEYFLLKLSGDRNFEFINYNGDTIRGTQTYEGIWVPEKDTSKFNNFIILDKRPIRPINK